MLWEGTLSRNKGATNVFFVQLIRVAGGGYARCGVVNLRLRAWCTLFLLMLVFVVVILVMLCSSSENKVNGD